MAGLWSGEKCGSLCRIESIALENLNRVMFVSLFFCCVTHICNFNDYSFSAVIAKRFVFGSEGAKFQEISLVS